MLPDPLHPAVVHLPLGLAVVAPAAALLVALAIRQSRLPLRAWTGILVLQAVMMASVSKRQRCVRPALFCGVRTVSSGLWNRRAGPPA